MSRNPYDKIGHFFQGFVPALIAREISIRGQYVKSGKMLGFSSWCVLPWQSAPPTNSLSGVRLFVLVRVPMNSWEPRATPGTRNPICSSPSSVPSRPYSACRTCMTCRLCDYPIKKAGKPLQRCSCCRIQAEQHLIRYDLQCTDTGTDYNSGDDRQSAALRWPRALYEQFDHKGRPRAGILALLQIGRQKFRRRWTQHRDRPPMILDDAKGH